jgi:predicted nucleic acid-binding protein
MFLLDTNAISELDKPQPNAGLQSWLSGVDWNDLFVSVITLAELWEGIARLPHGRKRRQYEASFELLPTTFSGRILPVDFSVAIRFGEIQATLGPLPALDTLIAATGLVHRLTVITRNTKDVARTGAQIHDPWN